MSMGPSDSAYFRTFLSLLDLRLFTCLGACPGEGRDEAHGLIAEVSDHARQEAFVPDEDEIAVCRALTDALIREQDEILSLADAEGLPAIEVIRECFGLDRDEMLLLTAILAPAVDERFRQIYRLFQGSEVPRLDFLLGLIEPDGLGRYEYTQLLSRNGNLLRFGLAETDGRSDDPAPSAVYRPAPGLLEWLNGVRSTGPFADRAEWREGTVPSEGQILPVIVSMAETVNMAENGPEPVPLISFYGPDEELLLEQTVMLAGELERDLLKLDLRGIEMQDAFRLLRIASRDCMLNRGVLVLTGIDQWVDALGILPAELGDFLDKWNTPTVLLSRRNVVFSPERHIGKRIILRAETEKLTGTQRLAVWKKQLETIPAAAGLDDEALRILAGQFSLSSAQIRAAVRAGLGIALTEERELRVEDLYEGARSSSMHHLSDLTKKMPTRYTINDLILPEKQKQEIDELIAMAKNRSLVLEDWGVGKKLVSGRGLSALFTGVPGTGKTLAAQAIAGELGLDLYRVDLSTIVSKYIGETEKNLEKIFTEAQNSNVILFFDEADSLFGRRSEVNDSHDRYANIEVGYLLQRIEVYDGIVLMATNLGANLDEAFARRINFIIDFPFPDEKTRLRLWKLLLPDNIEKEENIDLESFAAAYKIAGGNIRNAVVWAIYDAARNKHPLNRDDLLHGVEREYRKMGKVFIALR
ncbi:MAG: ATP-binding protein [Flexilinea sp.]|nr:ATP-binding protein [Flexilinea sp.]